MCRNILLLALLSTALLLSACGGGGGGTSPTVDDGSTTIRTTIDMDSSTKASSKAASSMVVTLTLADGTEVQMTNVGGNVYECRVVYTDGTPVYIKATTGQLTLENFMTSLDVSSGVADTGSTTPVTTLFVDVLKAYLGDSSDFVQSVMDSITSGDATLTATVNTIKNEVVENTDGTFTELINTYTQNLTWDNTDTVDQATLTSQVQSSEAVTGISEILADSGITTSDTVEAMVRQVALETIDKYYAAVNAKDFTGLSALMYAAEFLDNGIDGTLWLGKMLAQAQEIPEGYTLNLVDKDVYVKEMTAETDPTKYAALSPAGTPIYKLFFYTHEQVKDSSGNIVQEDAENGRYRQIPDMLVQKISGKWYLIGNQTKAEIWYNDDITDDYFYIQACEGSYPITSVTVSSPSGIFSGSAVMGYDKYETSCKDLQIHTDGTTYTYSRTTENNQYVYTGNSGQVTKSTSTPFCGGGTIRVVITYGDNTTTTKDFTMADCVYKTPSLSVTKNSDGSVTLTYSLPTEDRGDTELYVQNNGEEIYEIDSLPFDGLTKTIPASLFTSGQTYTFALRFYDLYKRGYYVDKDLNY